MRILKRHILSLPCKHLKDFFLRKRFIFFRVKGWIIGFTFTQDVIDGSEKSLCNGNNGFLLVALLLDGQFLSIDFGCFSLRLTANAT